MNEVAARQARDSQTIVANSITMLSRQALLWVLNSVLVLFLPKYLGDTGLGQLQFAISFVALFSVGITLGTRQFLVKEIARDRSQTFLFLSTTIGLRLIAAPLTLAAIVGATYLVASDAGPKEIVYVAALTMVVTTFAHLLTGVLHGMEDMTRPAAAEVAGKIVIVVAGVIVLVQGMGVLAYSLVLLLGGSVQLALSAAFVRRQVPLRIHLRMPQAKTLLMGGVPFLFMGLLLTAYNNTDVVMLRFYTQENVVGWYAAATQLLRAAEVLPLALTTAMLPTMARAHAEHPEILASIARKSIAVGTLVSVPLAAGLGILSPDLIAFLPYPDSFENSVPLLTILAFSIPVTALLIILGTIAIAVDRQNAWAIALLGTVVLNVALNVVAIPYTQAHYDNGGIGAALATVVSEGVMVAVGVWLMPRNVMNRVMGSLLLKVTLAAGVMVAVSLAARQLGLDTIPLAVLASVTYLALVLGMRAVTREDLMGLWQIAARRINRHRTPAA